MSFLNFKNIVLVFIILLVALISFSAGYTFKTSTAKTTRPTANTTQNTKEPEFNPIFFSQSATIQGKITELKEKTVTVVDDKGLTGSFTISDRLVIYKPEKKNSARANAYTDPKLIDLNQKALIILEMIDGKYQVVSISYDNN